MSLIRREASKSRRSRTFICLDSKEMCCLLHPMADLDPELCKWKHNCTMELYPFSQWLPLKPHQKLILKDKGPSTATSYVGRSAVGWGEAWENGWEASCGSRKTLYKESCILFSLLLNSSCCSPHTYWHLLGSISRLSGMAVTGDLRGSSQKGKEQSPTSCVYLLVLVSFWIQL